MRYIVSLFWLLFLSLQAGAQNSYADVTRMFCEVADSCQKVLSKTDDLTVLLKPLDELILDDEYILSDFRGPFRLEPKDISSLRLYARKKSMPRPSDDYFNPEYSRYRKCLKENVPYVTDADSVPFIFPFEKISLTGSKMSFWQAYLLIYVEHMIGMRNEDCYNQEYIITSEQDIDRVISLIKTDWETGWLDADFQKQNDHGKHHLTAVYNALDSLQALKTRDLAPTIEFYRTHVVIKHYAFGEFTGLMKRTITLYTNESRNQLISVYKYSPKMITRYRRTVFI